jgi:hypothetical protein
VSTVGTFGTTGTANGLSISGNSIILAPATATTPGAVSTGTQTFGGAKTFGGSIGFVNQTINSTAGTQTISLGASYVLISNSTAFTLNLPDATATNGAILWIRKLSLSNFTVTIRTGNLIFNTANASATTFNMSNGIRTLQFYFISPNWYLLYSA